ncbi:unnamed protein product [Heligmosomoides polygyrus]|uniref:Flavodoxin n=1 Tax=Heligmosomoides polygyrus TaxID=6339 RepID=A0A183GII1_HELPZ|nr:unnamed protein product [Heligmosomoides polygyrus]
MSALPSHIYQLRVNGNTSWRDEGSKKIHSVLTPLNALKGIDVNVRDDKVTQAAEFPVVVLWGFPTTTMCLDALR